MVRHLRANAIAYLALFVALGGTSYAAVSVTGKDVRDGSLTGADVKDGSLRGADIKDRSIKARDLARGLAARGPKGDPGPAGPPGPVGTVDTSGFYGKAESDARYVQGTLATKTRNEEYYLAPYGNTFYELTCDEGGVAAKARYEVTGVPEGYVTGEYSVAAHKVELHNPTSETLHGTVRQALTCVQFAVPPPALP